jgi:hypothetical protein
MGFYVEEADRSFTSYLANEDIHVGTLVVDNGSARYRRAEATDAFADVALATSPRSGAYVAAEMDETTDWTYASGERVPALYLADADRIKVRTAADNSTDPAASISDGNVVGIAAVGGVEFEGRLVEEGYTDDAGTTYGRESSGDFLAIGTAHKDSASSFDVPVRVRVGDL